ncbi:endonuclease [Pelagivirga sediminicola]|uniref:Endonuclease n=1 Tax=Pelagivirga sediminicola TaxID=2170575 RepID=A0A2T7GC70_9RHOB|nr:endonuclease/exonuclease/phosphatase family protein [Pelagivirga sediminicola]PVA12011.1 endonuclease [Pelagivirga sediminicola]
MEDILFWAVVGACWLVACVVVVVTFLPMANTNVWWIRAMDFPRPQIAVVGGAVLIAALFVPGVTRVVVPVLMVVACGYQLWRIYPYTVFAPVELKLASDGPDAVRMLSSNVLMENERHDLLLGEIEKFDPDILLLMETDQAWIDAVEPALAGYSTIIRQPKDDHYGMLFATRLPAQKAEFVRLTTDETPSVFAELTAPNGTTFRFVGLHPRPPVPGQDTEKRDAQIYYAARFARKSGVPIVVTGDFNDVAWSDTSRTFKHAGQYLDPRIGRGLFASFDAEKIYMRFPIDQLYVTEDAAIVSIERLAYIGSDHFPMAATIRFDADLAARLNVSPDPITESDLKLIEDSVEQTRETLSAAKF